MSWYLANEDGIIDQFASISGLADLRRAAGGKGYAAVKDFFDVGATKNTQLCRFQLYRIAKKSKDNSVAETAKGLAAMLIGQKTVWITDGTTGHPNSAKLQESAAPAGRSLKHPDHANRIDPIKKRVKRVMAAYFRRQKKAILQDVPLRFHVGKEYPLKEAADEDAAKKRASELLPESLSPLQFSATPDESKRYLSAIASAIKAGEDQLADEIEFEGSIGDNKIVDYLRDNSLSKLTGEIAETTKQRLRNAIADAIQANGTADDIVAAIKETMADFSDARSSRIAQQEVNSAYNWGRHELADQAGMTEKFWQTESAVPCPICILNMAQGWIDMEDNFISGDDFPPGHVGCYCAANYRLVSTGEGK